MGKLDHMKGAKLTVEVVDEGNLTVAQLREGGDLLTVPSGWGDSEVVDLTQYPDEAYLRFRWSQHVTDLEHQNPGQRHAYGREMKEEAEKEHGNPDKEQ